MEIHGTLRHKINIAPKDVIEKLIQNEIGWRGWIFKEDGKFYRGYEQSAGAHSYDEKQEISKQTYKYIEALQLVLKNLKEKE